MKKKIIKFEKLSLQCFDFDLQNKTLPEIMPETMHHNISSRNTILRSFPWDVFGQCNFYKKKKSEKIECRKHIGQIPRDLCHSIPADNHRVFFYFFCLLGYQITTLTEFRHSIPCRIDHHHCVYSGHNVESRSPSCIVWIEGQ